MQKPTGGKFLLEGHINLDIMEIGIVLILTAFTLEEGIYS